jgi:hypothetical protein
MAEQIKFLPAIPQPLVFDLLGRIQEVRDSRSKKSSDQPEPQHVTIKALIKRYEDGRIDGIQEVWVAEGKVGTKEEAKNCSGWVWYEVRLFILNFPA